MNAVIRNFKAGIQADDTDSVGRLLTEGNYQELINEGIFPFGKPPLAAAASVEMVDLLLECGADLTKVSDWWGAGFGTIEVPIPISEYLVSRGAGLTVHAAAGLGLVQHLATLLDENPDSITAKGGDGCFPLHFARTVEIASLLIDRGAPIDMRDEDHDSTAAQWRISDVPEVTKFLIETGAQPDIFMAAGLGDFSLVQCLVNEDPSCTSYRIGNNNGPFPGIGYKGRGGSIYQWTLGFNLSPHEVALTRGFSSIYKFLMKHTSPHYQLLVACMLADRTLAEGIVAENSGIIDQLREEDQMLVAKSCWETNLNVEAVRLMLDLGFPVDLPENNHGYSPLHNAAWCGNSELVRLLLDRDHAVDIRDPEHKNTALGWAIHSCIEAKRHPEGDFAGVVDLLLTAGTPFDKKHYLIGHEDIDEVLRKYLEL